MTTDGRRDPRQPISLEIRFKSATLTDFIERHSRDISRGGIFIKTKSPMPSGTLIKFDLGLQDSGTIIQGVGRVVWRRVEDANEESPAGMGIKFIKLDPKSRDNLDSILSQKTEQVTGPSEAPAVSEKTAEKEPEKEPEKPSSDEQSSSGQIAPIRPQAVPKEAKRTMMGIAPPSSAPSKPQEQPEPAETGPKAEAAPEPIIPKKPVPKGEPRGVSDVFTPDSIDEPPRETDILADISSAIDKALDFGEADLEGIRPAVQSDSPPAREISGAKPLQADLSGEKEIPGEDERISEVGVTSEAAKETAHAEEETKKDVPPGVVSTRAGAGKRTVPRSVLFLGVIVIVAVAAFANYYFLRQNKSGTDDEVLKGRASDIVKYTDIEIKSSPEGAKIYFNGELQSETAPMTIKDVPTGKEVEIKADLTGHLPTVEKLVPGDKTVDLDLKLEPAKTTIKFESRPDGASVVIDGRTWGKTPLTVAKKGLGPDVAYTLKKTGYEDYAGALSEKDWRQEENEFFAVVSVGLNEAEVPLGVVEKEPPRIELPKPEPPKPEPKKAEPAKPKPKKEKQKKPKEKAKKEEPKKEEPKKVEPKKEEPKPKPKPKKEEDKAAIDDNPF